MLRRKRWDAALQDLRDSTELLTVRLLIALLPMGNVRGGSICSEVAVIFALAGDRRLPLEHADGRKLHGGEERCGHVPPRDSSQR
jgi:hypothetical protein